MQNKYAIRLINENDASEVLAIYEHYVLNTIISFEYEAPTLEEYTQRIKTNTDDYPWLVCTYEDKIIGYAYASKHRYRTAYQWSPESTIYLANEAHGKGIGRILYETLFDLLKLQGHFNVYAGVALPNEKSMRFNKAMGFEDIGVFKKVGYKHGNWHDTHWFQLFLTDHVLNPATPKKLDEVINLIDFQNILAMANKRLAN